MVDKLITDGFNYSIGASLARSRDPFGTALATLRGRLRDGVYPPGEPLTIAELATELRFSTTPIREALAWLAGEGLIDDRRGKGYCCWRIEVGDLIALYNLHELYVDAALRKAEVSRGSASPTRAPGETSPNATIDPSPAINLIRTTASVFEDLVAASGDRLLVSAHASLSIRLGNVRRAEFSVFTDGVDELLGLSRAGELATSELIAAYHERRRENALAIQHVLSDQRIYSYV
ncbi:MAG: GntR family transcriptional regulator [Phenylobacterium sp.]|uniref:winged helix-turn-helix domain-containing protein n=1 Tax=Phenylobacterium sp. TaxID=1871053 RepID=UPI0025D378A0|nr:winged helix-turn-helix domain-containing protein [Phenylobacterium sp.]MBI1198944.1 GntR family transcriptional regulator [Phenylobacterium sp.]